MNTTGSNAPAPGLLTLLQQSAESGLPALMQPAAGEREFSSVMAELISPPAATAVVTAQPLLRHTLPPADESLPLVLNWPDTADEASTTFPVVSDLLGYIEQGQEALAARDSAAAESDDEEMAAAETLLFSPTLSSSAVSDQPRSQPVLGASGQRTPAYNRLAGSEKTIAGQVAADSAMESADNLHPETETDFYLPEDARRLASTTGAGTQPAVHQGSVAAGTTALSPAFTSPLTPPAPAAGMSESLNVADSAAEVMPEAQTSVRREPLTLGQDRQQWGSVLGSRILTLVADEVQEARIQLDPPELGSLEIKIRVTQEQTSVQVHAQNPQVRDVLEASAHRLRDALSGQGLTLSSFDVSEQGHSSGHGAGGQAQGEGQPAEGDWLLTDASDERVAEPSAAVSAHSLLDTFA